MIRAFIYRLLGYSTDRDKILNIGLSLALRFGKNWGQPIQERLSKRFQNLTKQELDEFNSICIGARDASSDFVFDTLNGLCNQNKKIKEKELKAKFGSFMMNNYPWINQSNMNSTYKIARYYAWKDGLDECIG